VTTTAQLVPEAPATPLGPPEVQLSERVRGLHAEVLGATPALCAERAVLVTRYFREETEPRAPMVLRKARALAHVLAGKRAAIHPGELLVGCFTSHRVGGGLFPELHGLAMMEDLLGLSRREVNAFTVAAEDRAVLLRDVLPYWATRAMPLRVFPLRRQLAFLADQMSPTTHLINEAGGISHFVPDYAGLIGRGTEGFRAEAAERLATAGADAPAGQLCAAVITVCDGLERFAARYRETASAQAAQAAPHRRAELEEIAAVCARVPRFPARTFREALQAILFAQIALNLESLDNAVSPGRLDQLLAPFYGRDVAEGSLDPQGAFELLGCFAVKLCEIVPMVSRRLTRFHGGLFNGQVLVVGGTDRHGADATNDVTMLFLELMDRLRTRQPNYHARCHPGSPPSYRRRIAQALAAGAVSPALYNDDVIVPVLRSRGVTPEDARDYANVGCVEPVSAGRSFFSTDAALFNLPLCLELALNRGRRFGHRRRLGAATPDAGACGSMEALVDLLRRQIDAGVGRMLSDLRGVEEANARLHPTPLTSMLIEGCLRSGRDATVGGATYNGSGVQGVGVVEVGDALAAVEQVVFRDRHVTMAELVHACPANFRGDEALLARLRAAPKYGNDVPGADAWVGRVMQLYAAALDGRSSSRGGPYVAGFYSVTAHVAFGEVVGALPSGRLAGEPFSSGISPGNGRDRSGPTAALRSSASLPLALAKNGVNFNLQLPPWLGGDATTLGALVDGGFAAGCMQMQVNVLDPKVLIEARDHPGRHPGLLVRVSGYSAYFDDLAPEVKEELIARFAGGAL